MSASGPGSEPGPDPAAAGTLLLYLWGSLAAFGAFLVAVPGREAAARAWLWIGLVLLGAGVAGLTMALRARLRHLRRRAR